MKKEERMNENKIDSEMFRIYRMYESFPYEI